MEMDYAPMEVLPAAPKSNGVLQVPEVPKPEPIEPGERPEDQQAANRSAGNGQVTHATYTRTQ